MGIERDEDEKEEKNLTAGESEVEEEEEEEEEEESSEEEPESPQQEDDAGEEGAKEDAGKKRPRWEDMSPEEKREARRKKRERERTRKKYTFARNAFLESRMNDIEAELAEKDAVIQRLMEGQTTKQKSELQSELGQLEAAYRNVQQAMSEAITRGDGATYTEAFNAAQQINNRYQYVRAQVDKAEPPQAEQAQKARSAPANPMVAHLATQWGVSVRYAEWDDAEKAVARSVDKQLSAQNLYDPATPEYYEELQSRIAKKLPYLFEDRDFTTRKKSVKSKPKPILPGAGKEAPSKDEEDISRLLPKNLIANAREAGLDLSDKAVRNSLIRNYNAESARYKKG